ncbi:MAG: nitrogenase component 1 [Dehalococcoidia bacterium]
MNRMGAPSDRGGKVRAAEVDPRCRCGYSGGVRASCYIKGVIPILHGFIGCNTLLRFPLKCMEREPVVFSTGMDEGDAVFGGESKLRESILKLDAIYHPQIIFLFSSCISDTIGDDMRGIARWAENQVSAKVIYVETGGYKCPDWEGFSLTLLALMQNLDDSPPREAEGAGKRVNLMGLDPWDFHGEGNREEMGRLLERAGLEVVAFLPGSKHLDDFKRARNANLNVVISPPQGMATAKWMEEAYRIPYIEAGMPIGFDGTREWLSKICSALAVPLTSEVEEEEKEAELKIYTDHIVTYEVLYEVMAGVFGDAQMVISLVRFLARELGITTLVAGVFEAWPSELEALEQTIKELNLDTEVLVNPDVKEIEEAMRARPLGLIFGSALEEIVAEKVYGYQMSTVRLAFPIFDEVNFLKIPYVGYRGAINLVEKAYNLSLKNRVSSFSQNLPWHERYKSF